jgi:predicted HTH transcriptional regulator|tara:strand:+ start:807 stop:1160 length:354 start_codon:yes stop_codon:yes gene_type:complete
MSSPSRIKPPHIAEQFSLPLGESYPSTPGYKNRDKTGPSRKAALSMKPHALNLRQKCFRAISQIPMTADEVAATIEKSILSVRPRIAELSKLGKIEDSGKRRTNESGKDATVWRIKL